MNEPNLQTLPTRSEVIRALGRDRSRIAAVYDETGARVILDGRDPGEVVGDGKTLGVLRCAICDASAGEVTLMKVVAERAEVKELAKLAGIEAVGYVCYGGDCAGQRNKAMLRPFVRAANAMTVTHLTKSGHAMQWQVEDGKSTLVYARTSRSAKQRKARRKVQAASRKANRSN